MKHNKGSYKIATQTLIDALDVLNFDPLLEMHRLYWKLEKLECKNDYNEILKTEAQVNIVSELMQYLYPKKKSIDVKIDIAQQPNIIWDFRFGDAPPDNHPSTLNASATEAEIVTQKV